MYEERKDLGKPPLVVAAAPVYGRRMSTTLSTLKGDNLERRSDPRLLRLARNLVRCAVIVGVVALHGKLPGPREFERNALPSGTARA
jgi:hypothetical protein